MTSLSRRCSALPERRKNGTPCQRQLSIASSMAANVGVRESAGDAALAAIAGVLAEHQTPRRLLRRRDGNGVQHLELFIAQRVGGVVRRRFHRHQGQQLQQVVLEHVAQHAGLVVVIAAALDLDLLGDGDLHVIDVIVVPQRLEQRVGEAENEDVLHRVLAEIMIDAIDLVLAEHVAEKLIERPRGSEIVAERLFDDEAPPTVGRGLAVHAGRAELLDDGRHQFRTDRTIVQTPGVVRSRAFVLLKPRLQRLQSAFLGGVGRDVENTARKAVPLLFLETGADETAARSRGACRDKRRR